MVNHHTRVDEVQEISCPRWQRTNSLIPKMIYEIWGSGKPVSFLWLSFLHVCLKKYAGEMRGATSFFSSLKDELTRVVGPLGKWSEVKDSRKTDTCLSDVCIAWLSAVNLLRESRTGGLWGTRLGWRRIHS